MGVFLSKGESDFEPEWEFLPEELWVDYILVHLPIGTLCCVALVSKRMNKLATDPPLWAGKGTFINKEKIVREGHDLSYLTIPRFVKITHLDLSQMSLPLEFVESFLKHILSDSCQIKSINLSFTHLVLPEGQDLFAQDNYVVLLIQAIANLQEFNLSHTLVMNNTTYATAIFERVRDTSHHQSFNISDMDLRRIPSNLFVESISSLKEAHFGDCKITSQQLTDLFSCIKNQKCISLTTLILYGMKVCPENPPGELAYSISRLEEVNLAGMPLMQEQLQAILQAVPKSSLLSLNLYGIDIRNVPEQVIRDATRHLNPEGYSKYFGETKDKGINDVRNYSIPGNCRLIFGQHVFSTITVCGLWTTGRKNMNKN